MNKSVKSIAVAAIAICTGALASGQSVKSTITLPNLPEQIAVNPLSNTIYVAVPTFGAKCYDYLSIIDGSTDKVISNVHIPTVAYAVAVDPFGNQVYVGGSYTDKNGVIQNLVIAVSTKTNKMTNKIHISHTPGDGIQGLAVNALNGDVYVTNGSDNEVDVIQNFKVTHRIAIAGEPFGITINPFTSQVYVARLDGNVSIINANTKAVTSTTAVGNSNAGIAVDLLTGNVFTSNAVYTDNSTVGALDASGNVLTNVLVGNTPFGIDVDPGTHSVFVANSQDGTVSVINETTETVSATLPVSGLFVAANPISEKVYVGANDGSSTLTVIQEQQ